MERFGRYELIKKIATGGMAEIYLARQAGIEGFEKLLVLKRILPHLAESEEFVEMFLHEARVAVRLNHPNIVQIFDLGEIDGSYFIAMEYIHGEDARRIWRQSENACNPIPVPLVCRIIMDAGAGLDYAHKRTDASGQPLNIIHRDVSPQNILVSFEGAVKVVDFGIAKAADQATQTRSGVLKGKYSYMSPEQASGREIDQRTDQFALGVVFYELLTFHRLFKRSNDIQTLTAVTECKVAPPSEVNSRIPKDLDPLVLKALAKNPDERFRDLGEMQMAIEEWLLNNKQASSSAHLSAFLKELYRDRLAREQDAGGVPVIQDQSEGSGSVSGRIAKRRASLSTIGQPSLADRTRAARRGATGGGILSRELVYTRGVAGDADDEPTPVEPEPITGSSVSRLLQRMSGRKKATLIAASVASLAALGGVFFLQPQGQTTTARQDVQLSVGNARGVREPALKLAGLKVVTNPAGALVVVDGKPSEERSPVTIAGLALGPHQVFVEFKGFKDEQRTVTLQDEGTIIPVSIGLTRDEAAVLVRLSVESEPAGAEISIDGKRYGRTPLVISMASGQHARIELFREGYRELKEELALGLEPEQRLQFNLERQASSQQLQPVGGNATLVITCDPQATLWEGKSQLGETPFHGKLAAGKHRLTLVNRDLGFERTLQLSLRPGETLSKDFRLEKGEVQIVATPWADVFLRGKKLGTTPMPKLTLYEGEHQFVLVNTDLGTKKTIEVVVRAGQLEKKIVNMAAE